MLLTLFTLFLKVGAFTFGSGYAMIALLQAELVEQRAWLSATEFADVVALAEVTPGPIMVNMATYVGYKFAGLPGALTATLGLVMLPVLAILLIARYYLGFSGNPFVAAAFRGLRPAVLALILFAVVKLGRTSLVDVRSTLLFGAVFALLALARLHPVAAATLGLAAGLVFFR